MRFPFDRRKSAYLLSVGLLVAFVTFCWLRSAAAQIPSDGPTKSKSTAPTAKLSALSDGSSTHELTRADAEEFFDLLIIDQLAREDIAGAIVGVVKDGKVLLTKGYGYDDVAKGVRATGDASLFRIGSISKLITWTAAMQLVEQKKLALDEDVNNYLDFKIPPAFGKPITLRNLMTHNTGFEDTWRDLGVAEPQQLIPLETYVKTHMPKRIYPPGVVSAYSNYGATLTGYLVQRVSGKPFDVYVDENVFRPLGMNRTTFAQPVPAALEPMVSQGYGLASSPAGPFEYMVLFPAGSVSAPASDMCKFMLAHLQDGQLNGAQILSPETARLMHSRTLSFDERMNSWAYGFYEESTNGHRIIGHGGDLQRFHSDLHLILDAKTGFFISYNSKGNGDLGLDRQRLLQMFMDRYFPPNSAESNPASDGASKSKEDAAAADTAVAGIYHASRRWESSVLKLVGLFPAPNGQVEVSVEPDNSIRIESFEDAAGQPLKFRRVASMFYEDAENHQRAAFRRGWDGKMQMQVGAADEVFIRVDAIQKKSLNYFILCAGLGVVVLTLIFWPIGALVRKNYARPLELSASERSLRITERLVCILFCVLFFGWMAVFVVGLQEFVQIMTGLGRWIILFGIVGILCSIGTLILWWKVLPAWKGTDVRPWIRVHVTVVALACTGLLWFAVLWNLMNFNLHY